MVRLMAFFYPHQRENPDSVAWMRQPTQPLTIEIVDLPIENGDFPWFFVCLPGRIPLQYHGVREALSEPTSL
jgi:hypothetical protein